METLQFDKLKYLEDQVKDLNRRLAEAEAYKGHFLSNIRNAMTNPFTSIVGLSEEIIRVDKEAWKKVIMLASLIHSEASSLDFQMQNVFCAAELESGNLTPGSSRTEVNSLIRKVIEKYKYIIRKKNLTVNYDFDYLLNEKQTPYFNTDPGFIEKIVINLFDNAVKFTRENGHINFRVSQSDGFLKFTIRDDGKGISDSGKIYIFDRFKRLENNINSIESGHGLGLSVCKVLVELLNGTLDFESNPGAGTTFTVIIPELNSKEGEAYSTEGNEFLFIGDKEF